MPYCVRCKKLIKTNDRFCPECEKKVLKGEDLTFDTVNDEERFSEIMANLDTIILSRDTFAELFEVDAKEYANIPIGEYELSVRVVNCLNQMGVSTQEQLLLLCPALLMSLKNFGRGSLVVLLKYLLKLANSYKEAQKNNDIEHLTLSAEQRQFLISNYERFKKKEYQGLREENHDSKELLQLISVFEKQECIDYDLLYSCLMDPDKAFRLYEVMADMRDAFEKFRILKDALDRLPAYKVSNLARYYLLAYDCSPAKKSILRNLYSDTNCSLDSILTNLPEQRSHVDLVLQFLKWCDYDVADDLSAFMGELYKNERIREVLRNRAAGMTLGQIGEFYGLTRERIRQIESRASVKFNKFQSSYKFIPKICADRNGDTVLTPAEISYYCGEYTEEILYLLKSSTDSNYKYSISMNVFFVNSDGSEEGQILSYAESLPDTFEEHSLCEILRKASEQEGLSEELLEQYISKTYILQGNRYVRAKLRRSDMFRHVLALYFPDGIRISDTNQLKEFKLDVCREFGIDFDISDRALAARLGDLGVLCDRSTYKLKQEKYISDELADEIESFISSNKAPIMPLSYVYRVFRERLKVEGIGNIYYFLGILHELFDEKFYIRKHYVSSQKEGLNVYELLQKAIRESDKPISRAQLQQLVPGLTPIVVIIATDVPEILNYWGYYFHGEKTKISIQESRDLENWLDGFLSDGIVHDSHEVFDYVQRYFPSVLRDNYAKDPNGCFSLLQYWFRDQYQFVRPYLSKKGVEIKRPSQRLREFIYSKDEVLIDDLSAYLKEIGLDKLSQLSIAKACDDKFFLISNTRLVAIDKLGINEQIAEKVESIILPYVSGTMPIRDLPCFPNLPMIKEGWTDWLVYSTLRKWSSKLTVGESYNQIRLAVPLIAKNGEYDSSVVFVDSKQQTSFSTDNLDNLDELLEEMIDWEDLDTE